MEEKTFFQSVSEDITSYRQGNEHAPTKEEISRMTYDALDKGLIDKEEAKVLFEELKYAIQEVEKR